jgi:hypothetical protein
MTFARGGERLDQTATPALVLVEDGDTGRLGPAAEDVGKDSVEDDAGQDDREVALERQRIRRSLPAIIAMILSDRSTS